jgi:hypothetical protein
MGGVVIAVFVFAGGFIAAAIARATRPAPPPRMSPNGPSPPPVPPSPGGGLPPGYGTSLAPVKPDPGVPSQRTLDANDVATSPFLFALAAGYSSVDEMVDSNPQLRLIDSRSESGSATSTNFPPDFAFNYVVKGTSDIFAFSPTERLDVGYDLPTYKSGNAEWVFPTWELSSSRPDLGVKTYEGHYPISSSGSAGRVFSQPLAIAPFYLYRGITPWSVGTIVRLKGG